MADIYARLAARLRLERNRLGWTQEELADRAGLHPAYVGQIERNSKKVSLATVDKLCAALRVSPGRLLDSGTAPARGSLWESRIEALFRDRPARELELLYSTLRQLARGLARARRR